MHTNKSQVFAQMLGIYGTDFRRMIEAEGLEDATIDELRDMYLDVIDMCYAKNTASNNKKIDWIQIKNVHELGNKYCFDVLVTGSVNNVCRRDFEEGEELGMLLKDYEFRLLEKLSIIRKVYKKMHDQGLTFEDLSTSTIAPDGYESVNNMTDASMISTRTSVDEVAEEECSNNEENINKTRGIAIIVKNVQHGKSAKPTTDEKNNEEHHIVDMNSESVSDKPMDSLTKHSDTHKTKSKTKDWVEGDYSSILRLSRRYQV
ncbi:hypothetical protein CWI42_060570 [Ordospora colligata]|uniref:Uncharacterized protein n=1 Tax=Ordospora colligata OC4 TaxID=1354746 RepID=A0A0B2UJL9_9MICR|nr:uncharacterized protein M896_060570 [Ordospora colligata OC4]KHN69558.1 hypothetical protein M896_060570 [Ordospora colligata OC4]TBU15378.1 hypothetical protein CWI41_060560 [Ordospora colligata]TBU15478.1 hypothetical protein CWI40_060560 [Ordospora colligata]TBU18574.1 hypothetical protein CWI42_060570 [Ordospora colligata]